MAPTWFCAQGGAIPPLPNAFQAGELLLLLLPWGLSGCPLLWLSSALPPEHRPVPQAQPVSQTSDTLEYALRYL